MRSSMETKWKSLLGYMPSVVRLLNGWFIFHFLSYDNFNKIKALSWIKGRGFLALHSWYVGFNPLKETPENKLIWVKFPGLPIKLQTRQVFMDIGNAIGNFIYINPQCLGAWDKIIIWILIEKEYLDHIEIIWEGIHLAQKLDFWGVPFRCHICQHTGHLMVQCPCLMGGRRMAHRGMFYGAKDKAGG